MMSFSIPVPFVYIQQQSLWGWEAISVARMPVATIVLATAVIHRERIGGGDIEGHCGCYGAIVLETPALNRNLSLISGDSTTATNKGLPSQPEVHCSRQ